MKAIHVWVDATQVQADTLERMRLVCREYPGAGEVQVHVAASRGRVTVHIVGVDPVPPLADTLGRMSVSAPAC